MNKKTWENESNANGVVTGANGIVVLDYEDSIDFPTHPETKQDEYIY